MLSIKEIKSLRPAGNTMVLSWAVFRNYALHAEEIGGNITDYPRFFLMPHSCNVEAEPDGSNIIRLADPNDHVDHEVEMVVRLGEDLKPEAMCIGCDTTNRTRQGKAKVESWPWLEGKAFVGSAVLGTWTEWDPRAMRLILSVNGEVKQDSSTSEMIHSVNLLIETLVNWYGVSPGDYVWTGTPHGVGRMFEGDVVECRMINLEGEEVSKINAVCVI